MNGEFTTAWRGEGDGVFIVAAKAPIGAEQPVLKVIDQHRLKFPTGVYVQDQH